MAAKSGPHKCQQCEKEFTGRKGRANKYCSRECKHESQKKDFGKIECSNCGRELTHFQKQRYGANKRFYENKNEGEKYSLPYCSPGCVAESKKISKVKSTCKVCGNKFLKSKCDIRNHNHGHYCSLKCKGLASRNRIKCICGNCGKEFEKIESRTSDYRNGEDGDFCKKECFYVWRRKNRKKEITLHCDYCSEKFKIWQSKMHYGEKHSGIFCSRKCRAQSQRNYPSILTSEEYRGLKNKLYKKSNGYAKNMIRNKYGISYVPESLAQAKSMHLRIKRKIKSKKQ